MPSNCNVNLVFLDHCSDMFDQREEKVAKEKEWRHRVIADLERNCDDMRAQIYG